MKNDLRCEHWRGSVKVLVLAAAAFSSILGCSASAAGDYALKQKFVIGGEGGWDYLTYDATANRLFVSRGTHVQVIDPAKGTVLADIPDTPGVHGIALADDLGKGFISNGRDNSVTVIDLKTLRTLTKIKTEGGENPDFIAYDSVSKRVLAFNGRSHNASVIDATELKLVATIPLDGKPEAAVTDGTGALFVNIEDKDEITKLDAGKAEAVTSWPIVGCHEPAALAIDREKRKLFIGCQNRRLVVVNADSGKDVATLPIGAGVDAAAFDSDTKLVFSSQDDGSLTIISEVAPGAYAVVQNVVTQLGARTLALNPGNHDLYLVTAQFEIPAEGQARPRRTVKAGTFTLLVVSARN
jgi:DNA-binding beta-propeller fold protein YncE